MPTVRRSPLDDASDSEPFEFEGSGYKSSEDEDHDDTLPIPIETLSAVLNDNSSS